MSVAASHAALAAASHELAEAQAAALGKAEAMHDEAAATRGEAAFAAGEAFGRMDKNNDGVISREEFEQAKRGDPKQAAADWMPSHETSRMQGLPAGHNHATTSVTNVTNVTVSS